MFNSILVTFVCDERHQNEHQGVKLFMFNYNFFLKWKLKGFMLNLAAQ